MNEINDESVAGHHDKVSHLKCDLVYHQAKTDVTIDHTMHADSMRRENILTNIDDIVQYHWDKRKKQIQHQRVIDMTSPTKSNIEEIDEQVDRRRRALQEGRDFYDAIDGIDSRETEILSNATIRTNKIIDDLKKSRILNLTRQTYEENKANDETQVEQVLQEDLLEEAQPVQQEPPHPIRSTPSAQTIQQTSIVFETVPSVVKEESQQQDSEPEQIEVETENNEPESAQEESAQEDSAQEEPIQAEVVQETVTEENFEVHVEAEPANLQALATPQRASPPRNQGSPDLFENLDVLEKEYKLGRDLLTKAIKKISVEGLRKLSRKRTLSSPEVETVSTFLQIIELANSGTRKKKTGSWIKSNLFNEAPKVIH